MNKLYFLIIQLKEAIKVKAFKFALMRKVFAVQNNESLSKNILNEFAKIRVMS